MFSKLGYKRNSPDKKRKYNVINSPSITMQDVPHPVLGIGNNGYQQLMMPGQDYYFQGADQVLEIPVGYHRMPDGSLMSNKDMRKGGLTSNKAKEMLRDGTAHGKKLTAKQKRYFGWIAGGRKQDGGFTPLNRSPFRQVDQNIVDIQAPLLYNPNQQIGADRLTQTEGSYADAFYPQPRERRGLPDFGSFINFANAGVSALANTVENRRKKQYEMANLANPFNYLPVNNPTGDNELYGIPSYQDGGELEDDGFDSLSDAFLWEEDQMPVTNTAEEQVEPEQQTIEIPDEVIGSGEDDYMSYMTPIDDIISLMGDNDQPLDPNLPVVSPTINSTQLTNPSSLSELSQLIADKESAGGDYKAFNPAGGGEGAVGKYQFRWKKWKPKISAVTGIVDKQDFLNNPQAQESFYNWYEQNELIPAVGRIKRYNDANLSDVQLAKLVHYRGEQGAIDYLQGRLSDKPEDYNMSISKYIK